MRGTRSAFCIHHSAFRKKAASVFEAAVPPAQLPLAGGFAPVVQWQNAAMPRLRLGFNPRSAHVTSRVGFNPPSQW
jgi:hypothetical protein